MTPREEMRAVVREEMSRRIENTPTRKRIQWRLGRRGAFLVTMGVLYLMLAFAYGTVDLPRYTLQQLQFQTGVFELLGATPREAMKIWGALWGVSGIVALVTAWYPPGRDHYGFGALVAFALVWAMLSFMGEVFLDAPRAFIFGLIFLVHAITVFIASGMVDPGPVVKVVADDES